MTIPDKLFDAKQPIDTNVLIRVISSRCEASLIVHGNGALGKDPPRLQLKGANEGLIKPMKGGDEIIY